jgi:ATP-binding cassette subfamily B protein
MFDEEEYTASKLDLNIWKKLFKVIFTDKRSFIALIISGMLLAFLDIANNWIIKYVMENFLINDADYSTLWIYITINSLFIVLFALTVWFFIKNAGKIEVQSSYLLRDQAYTKLQRLSFSYYDTHQHGWLMARMTSDSRKLSNILSWSLFDVVWMLALFLFIGVTLFITNWLLALIFLAVVPIMLVICVAINKLVLKQNRKARQLNSKTTSKYNETLTGAKTIKALGIEESNLQEFQTLTVDLKRSSLKAITASSLLVAVMLTLCYAAVAIVYVGGGNQVLNGVATSAEIYLFISLAMLIVEPIMAFGRNLAAFQTAQASAERLMSLIEETPVIVDQPQVLEKYGDLFADHPENWEPITGEIELQDISFYYKANDPILSHFNLKIPAGQTVALVGHTGSGKTTIANLVCRFYEPNEGKILIDGVDYRERSLHWLHHRLGYVIQTPELFSCSILENIRYGRLEATEAECIAAATVVGANTFIDTLPQGYQTLVGEGGNSLSIGQKQLISLARAILVDPRILVLDEATSSVDSEAEQLIQAATQKLLANRTNIVIAHRLSTIVNADLIVMLENGEILEQGTHQELITLRGHYFELYRQQFFVQQTQSRIEQL